MRITKITFGRVVLTTQVKFEKNNRISVEMEAELEDGENAETAFEALKRRVDGKIANEIIAIELGKVRQTDRNKAVRQREMARAVQTAYGLDLSEEYIVEVGDRVYG